MCPCQCGTYFITQKILNVLSLSLVSFSLCFSLFETLFQHRFILCSRSTLVISHMRLVKSHAERARPDACVWIQIETSPSMIVSALPFSAKCRCRRNKINLTPLNLSLSFMFESSLACSGSSGCYACVDGAVNDLMVEHRRDRDDVYRRKLCIRSMPQLRFSR